MVAQLTFCEKQRLSSVIMTACHWILNRMKSIHTIIPISFMSILIQFAVYALFPVVSS
jgi:hypothetical protein